MQKISLRRIGGALIFLISGFAMKTVNAGTCVSSNNVYDGSGGPSGGPWTLAGSPYILKDAYVVVPDGKTLTIEPGVTVLLSSQGGTAYIQVNGTLVAKGVTFTGLGVFDPKTCSGSERQVPGTWSGIFFNDPDAGCILENCRITYGYHLISMSGPNQGMNSNLTIKDCFVGFGAGIGAFLNNNASPTILSTTFQGNANGGLRDSYIGAPVVDGCTFIGNGSSTRFDLPSNYPISTYADNVKNYTNLFISGNAIDAIWVWGEAVSTGTWQDHGVPYHLFSVFTTDVTIQDGNSLTLEPGVDIRFGPNRNLYVQGTLVADGDSCRRITFDKIDTSATATWGSIILPSSDPGTIFDNCDYTYAGGELSLVDVGSNVTISNCRITRSANNGINVSGNSAPFILSNLISGNRSTGVRATNSLGFVPILRNNLITNNAEGIRNYGVLDLGTVVNPGHNAFVNNTGYELYNSSAATISAIGNYWVATDSAVIDSQHVFDDDENASFGRVILNPVDFTDQSRSPQGGFCPPSCAALSISITSPTTSPAYQTTSRYLTLAGTATDDRGVLSITWTNATTGQSGTAMLGPSRRNLNWSAANIALNPGQNYVNVLATDGDGCTASDQITVTSIAGAGCWEDDSFDNLNLGSLDGQNGWATVPGRASVSVITDTTGPGQVLLMDVPADTVAIMEKDVPDQTEGMHSLELLVRVEPSDTSMAKVEVKTTGNPNWDKKFQLYFGTSMRLNYGPTQPEAVFFLAQTERQRWYHVRVNIDLNSNLLDLFLDGVQILNDIPVGTGPITQLSISAFDFPGSVLFDDIRGCRIVNNQLPYVVAPIPDQTVRAGSTTSLDLSGVFVDPDGDMLSYSATSSDTAAVKAGVAGNVLSLAALNNGMAMIVVRADDSHGGAAQDTFNVTVNAPQANRIVRVPHATSTGNTVSVPIQLIALGNENALGFSLSFDPTILSNPQAQLGEDAASASLLANNSQQALGRLGIAVALPANQAFIADTLEIVVVTFAVNPTGVTDSTVIDFADQPIGREVADIKANPLPAIYQSGTVNLILGYEADVAPRPFGSNNGTVTIADWVQVGRFVALLDTAQTDVNEFQRADCAPKSCGDGRVSISDWVQAGRYAAGLDSAVPACGPTNPTSVAVRSKSGNSVIAGHFSALLADRNVHVLSGTFRPGYQDSLKIALEAQGDENALGFSLNFDPTILSYDTAFAGSGASNATLNTNKSQAANGRAGFALALPTGQKFSAGVKQIIVVIFSVNTTLATDSTTLSFGDHPITREVVDANANILPTNWTPSKIAIIAPTRVEGTLSELPVHFELSQNYPNPFNPSTTIAFSLPTARRVALTIFNVLGEEVALLVNQEMAAGRYNIQWNAGNMQSGVYFYRLRAGDFVQTRKLSLMK